MSLLWHDLSSMLIHVCLIIGDHITFSTKVCIDQLSYSNESRFELAIFTSKQQTYWAGWTREVGCFLPMWARSWQDLFVPALSPPATCLSVTKTGHIRPHCMTTTSGTCNWGQNIRSWWIVLHVLAFNCFGDLVAVESRTYDIINNYIIIING